MRSRGFTPSRNIIHGDNKLQFRDANLYIHSNQDGTLALSSDSVIKLYGPYVDISEYLRHVGDTDTLIRMTTNEILYKAGGKEVLKHNATGLTFFGGTPIAQESHITDPTDLAECIVAINAMLASLEGYGLLADS